MSTEDQYGSMCLARRGEVSTEDIVCVLLGEVK